MKLRYSVVSALLGLFAAFIISCAQENTPKNTSQPAPQTEKRINQRRQFQKPYVVMVSIDGYRHDYTKKYNPPNLTQLSENGVQATSLRPSYPSLTFPNHYTLVTGLTPAHHGIVGNNFYDKTRKESYSMMNGKNVYDGTWYSGVPLWRAVSLSGMLSATLYWVGSEAEIAGGKADYVQPWSPPLDHTQRVDQVIKWLSLPEENRPHFVTLYFSAVDHAGHIASPDSNEVKNAVLDVDAAIGRLRDFARHAQPPVNIVVVSDHGMKALESDKYIKLYEFVDLKQFKIEERGSMVQMYSENTKLIEDTIAQINKIGHIKAYKRADIPEKFQYRDSERIGDIVVVADAPYYIRVVPKEVQMAAPNVQASGNGGTHGWDPEEQDMHGIFYAEGPSFKRNMKIATFQNIHIYPMMLDLFGISKLPSDGDRNVLRDILVK